MTRMLMLALLLGCLLGAAEQEVFTLRDGRVVTGAYDPLTGVIQAKIGRMTAEIKVEPQDIVSRRAAPTAPPPAPTPAPPAVPPGGPAPVDAGLPASNQGDARSLDELLAEAERRKEAARAAAAERDRQAAEARRLEDERKRQEAARESEQARLINELEQARQPQPPTIEELRRQAAQRAQEQKDREANAMRLDCDEQMAARGLGDVRVQALLSDLAKYQTVASDPTTADLAPAAWAALLAAHSLSPAPVGDVAALLAQLTPAAAGKAPPGILAPRSLATRPLQVGSGAASLDSERAIAAGLLFLRRHQSPNGMWDAEKYFQNCTLDPKAEPGSLAGHSAEQVNVAATGLVLLACLGSGYDHQRNSVLSHAMRTGIAWLLSIQNPDGLLGSRNYEHAIATAALAEALAMTSDRTLRKPVDAAVAVILSRQNRMPGAKERPAADGRDRAGWDYVKPSNRTDFSITCWNVMALRSAAAAGCQTQAAIAGATRAAVEAAAAVAKVGQKADFPYTWNGSSPEGVLAGTLGRHALGLYLLGGTGGRSQLSADLAPPTFPGNLYHMHWTMLGLRQGGGEPWSTYGTQVRTVLAASQIRADGCLAGSWNWEGCRWHGHETGRVFSTALAILCLEAGYRYAPAKTSGR